MEERKDIVIYQSEDGLVKMEAMVDASNETIWATQKAISELFGVGVNTINYHIKDIFDSSELQADSTIRKNRIVQIEGKRQVR